MKFVGIAMAVFGGLMELVAVQGLYIGKYDLSKVGSMQGFVGLVGVGLLFIAAGLSFANRKTPPTE